MAIARQLVLTPVEDGTEVVATWDVLHRDAAPVRWALAAPSTHVSELSVDGDDGEGRADPGPAVVVQGEGTHRIALRAFVPEGEPLRFLAAPRGSVAVADAALQVVVGGEAALEVDGLAWTGAQELVLVPRPPEAARVRQLAMARVSTGLTVQDDRVQVEVAVQVLVREGERQRVVLEVENLPRDVDVQGSALRSWSWEGDRIAVELSEPIDDLVTLQLSATVDVAEQLATPVVRVRDVFRTEAVLQLARPDDLDVLPELDGWRAIARQEVPEWAGGQVDGAPRASFLTSAPRAGRLSVLRFEPVERPPLLVDVADWRLATTDEGRVLLRGLLDVRNERASHLRISLPPGLEPVGVTVSGVAALPVRDGDDWLLPLERSVETVEGLLSFPVELSLLGEWEGWARREERSVPLPTLGAPVQVARVTLVLPPGYRDRGEDESLRVEQFSDGEGIRYGFAIGDTKGAVADATFRDALDAWKANDFTGAQAKLDDLRSMGAEGSNIYRLQSNVDLIVGGESGGDERVARRVRSQARARAVDQERAWQELQQLATEAEQRGDYGSSSAYYEQAIELGDTISLLDGEEDVDVRSSNAELRVELDAVQQRRAQLESVARESGRWDDERDGTLPWEVDNAELPWQVEGLPGFMRGEGEGVSGFGSVGAVGYGSGGGSMGIGRGSISFSAEPVSGTMMSADSARIDVHASRIALDIPVMGEVLRFERLLLPESVPLSVRVVAKNTHPRG